MAEVYAAKSQIGGIIGGQIGRTVPDRPETQLERACSEIDQLCAQLTELTGKVSTAADRLYGTRPECDTAVEREHFNDGLSGRILHGLAELSSRLSDAEEQVNRLEA